MPAFYASNVQTNGRSEGLQDSPPWSQEFLDSVKVPQECGSKIALQALTVLLQNSVGEGRRCIPLKPRKLFMVQNHKSLFRLLHIKQTHDFSRVYPAPSKFNLS